MGLSRGLFTGGKITLSNEIINLIDELERQKQHIEKLQKDVGRWRRMAQDKAPRPEFVRESHDERNRHIIDVALKSIAGDLHYLDVLDYLKYDFLPKHYPYYYLSIYHSKRLDSWVVRIAKDDVTDMETLKKWPMPGI
jgi:hypothetical protein